MGTAPGEAAEATLELTLLSIDIHSSHTFLTKQKPSSISAWLDPAHKRSTRSHNRVLHLPLSLLSLQNPSSTLTVQLLSPRFSFKLSRASASASALLSSLPLSGGLVTLHLRRPSGRVSASVRFSVRILWSLGPDPIIIDGFSSLETEAGLLRLQPSAPPLPPGHGNAPDEKMRDGSTAWRNFLFGALSGAVTVVALNFIRRQ